MKKLFALGIIIVLVLSLGACNSKNESVPVTTAATIEEPVVIVESTAPAYTAPTAPIVKEIEITTENWNDYFEAKEYVFKYKNDFGEYEGVVPCVGVFLKDEYLEKLVPMSEGPESEVTFEIEYDKCCKQLKLDANSGEYTLIDKSGYISSMEGRKSRIESTKDRRGMNDLDTHEYEPISPYGSFAAELNDGDTMSNESGQYILAPYNPSVLRAKGTIYLYD